MQGRLSESNYYKFKNIPESDLLLNEYVIE